MSNIQAFKQSIEEYLKVRRINRELFANKLGYGREHVSRILHGKAKMPEGFVHSTIRVLAELDCIHGKGQARKLLRLMDELDFTLDDWNTKPLAMLDDTASSDITIVAEASSFQQDVAHDTYESTAFPLWTVPYPRNPLFTGRDDILNRLHQQLFTERHNETTTSKAALTQPQAIKGLGGIGKTQIAIEYAYRSSALYACVFWINAATETALISSFVDIAKQLPSFLARNETDQQELVAAVKRWLEQHNQRWLLIFDNIEADDFPLMQKYLPQRGNGSILFTTRANSVRSLGASSIEVEKMELMEGTKMLLRHVERFDRAFQILDEARNETTRVVIDEAIATVIDEATNLVIVLDHFPLALDQAGAYIEETGCSLADYLQIYQAHRKELLERRGLQATDYPDSVVTTWSLSFDKVEQANLAATELLRLCAFLAPDNIPEELITNGVAHWSPPLQQAASNLFSFNQMIEELLKFSLVQRLVETQTLSIHRLVQAVQRDTMEPDEQRQWADSVIQAVNEVFPLQPSDIATWPQCLRYLDQAQVCNTLIEQYILPLTTPRRMMIDAHRLPRWAKKVAPWKKINSFLRHVRSLLLLVSLLKSTPYGEKSSLVKAASLLNRTGLYLIHHALYAQAEPLYQHALAIFEWELGANHPDTATGLNNLAGLYEKQGRYGEAEPLLLRALAITEEELGAEHPDTASSLGNLAILYESQGRYAEAEPLYQRALAITEQQLGVEHPDTATNLDNLAGLYERQGRYEEAGPLYQRALVITEQKLGAEHPDTATRLNNLAGLYNSQGRYEEAEPLCQRALAITEQQLGVEHPNTATSLDNLAGLYESQGRYEEVEPLYQRALSIRQTQLGVEHSDTAVSLNNLAGLYEIQGRYEEAEPLYLRALVIRQAQLGTEHPDTATSLNNLAILYKRQGRYREAEPLFLHALSIRQTQLGAEHPDTVSSLNNLAGLYESQGRYKEAEPLYQHALAIFEEELGVDHPDTANSLNGLAVLYEKQGRYQEAEPLYLRALAIKQAQLGDEHPDTAVSLNNLAGLYESQGRYEEAEPLYLRALAIKQTQLGTEHPSTAISLNNLAFLYESQGRYEEAEPLYQHALAIKQAQLGIEHPDTASSLNNLAKLYQVRGRYPEAEPLYKRALTICTQQLGSEHPTTQRVRSNYVSLQREIGRDEEADLLEAKGYLPS